MELSVLEQVVTLHVPMIQRLNVRQFHQMLELGVLREGEPIELIDGLLVRFDRSEEGGDPMVHGPRHALAISRLQRLAPRFSGLGCHLRCQLPVTLSDLLEPEPDAAVVQGEPEDYPDRHPGPADTLAVIEIADSSLDYDRTTKQQIYAAAGISVYWIVNLSDRLIEVYSAPVASAGRYRNRTNFQVHETLALEIGTDGRLEFAVADILT